MFDPNPTARADLKPGTLYAMHGENDWIYYGQVSPEKVIGFFRRRDKYLEQPEMTLTSELMSVVCVAYPSIGRAIRSGRWKRLGRFALSDALNKPHYSVRWPFPELNVTVWCGEKACYVTGVDDPEIQNMERMAVWDAEFHIPARLTADFGEEAAEWHVGGPIYRERRIKEEYARRFPDRPEHRLPPNWVPTAIS